MNEIKIPQLEKFSILLKLKLAISVIQDTLDLILRLSLIGGLIYAIYWGYINKIWQ